MAVVIGQTVETVACDDVPEVPSVGPDSALALRSRQGCAACVRPWILLSLLGMLVGCVGASRGAAGAAARAVPPPRASVAEARATSAPAQNAIALRVNGIAVDRTSFERGLAAHLRAVHAPSTDTAAREAYREALIDQLLVEDYAHRTRLDRDAEFLRRLAAARRQLLLQFVLEREIDDRISITTDSVARYYEEHKAESTEPERVQVRHILTRSREDAERARGRVVAGEDFAAVAAEMSIHASKSQGGLLPPFSRGTYQAEFERAAFALKVGELSGIVQTELGFHVVEKTAEEPARTRPLAEVAPAIRRLLFEQARKQRAAEFLKALRRDARIDTPDAREPSQ